MRLGCPTPLSSERPPYQTLPAGSAADIGSQQRFEVSGAASPGTSVCAGIEALVNDWPSFVIHALNPPPPLAPTTKRLRLPGTTVRNVSDWSLPSSVAFFSMPGLARRR